MSFQISVSTNMKKLAARLGATAEKVTNEETVLYLEQIRDNAVAKWPVDTGLSRSSFFIIQKLTGDRKTFSLVNRVEYVRFINGGETVRRLLLQPFKAGTPGLAEIIRERIRKG